MEIPYKETLLLSPTELLPNPANDRDHGDRQRQTFRAVAEKVGFAGAFLAYRSPRNGGKLTLLDGHMRQQEVDQTKKYPVVVLELTDEQADAVLQTYDPITVLELARTKAQAMLDSVLAQRTAEASAAREQVLARQVETPAVPVPQMTQWVLLGIPLAQFGTARTHLAALEKIAAITVKETRA